MPKSQTPKNRDENDVAEDLVKEQRRLLSKFRRTITAFKKDSQPWYDECDRIVRLYEGGAYKSQKRPVFNVLWSNVQTLLSTVFTRLPKVVCERRFKDKDPVGRLASKILERAVQFSISQEENDLYFALNESLRDRLLGGLGINWVRYEPFFEEVVDEATQTSREEEVGTPIERISFEEARTDYIHPKDFGWNSSARTWGEVRAVWKRVRVSKQRLKELFPEKWDSVPLDAYDHTTPPGYKIEGTEIEPKADVIEFWDKETKTVYWFSEGGGDEFLKIVEDPLRLKHFFPIPRPLLATLTGRKLFPTPDYVIYQDLAVQLDDVIRRAGELTRMVRLTGVHAASINENLEQLRTAPDGFTIPLLAWDSFKQAGGFQGVMQWIPIADVANSLKELEQRAVSIQQKIDLITGMSDIIRGGSNPYETKGAQQIKDKWATSKVTDRQHDMVRYIKDLVVLKGEVLCKHFQDSSLFLMSGVDSFTEEEQSLIPQSLMLLRDDNLRTFKLDVETDSTIAIDEAEDKASRMEAINAIANLIQQTSQMLQVNPAWEPLSMQLIQFGIRGYRAAREFEGFIQAAIDDMDAKKRAAEQQPPAPPPPDPAQMELEQKGQIAQAEIQLKQQIAQAEQQVAQFIAQSETQIKQMKLQSDRELKEAKLQMQAQAQAQKMQLDMQAKQIELQQNAESMVKGNDAMLKANEQVMQALQKVIMLLECKPEKEEKEERELPPIIVNVDANKGSTKKIVKLSSGASGTIEEVPTANG